jgi:hypothetical protein
MNLIFTIPALIAVFIISLGMMGLVTRFILHPLFCLLSLPTYAALHMFEHGIALNWPNSNVRKWCSLSQPKTFGKKLIVNGMASLTTLIGIGFFRAFISQAIPEDESFFMWNSASNFADQSWAPALIILFWGSLISLLYLNKKAVDDGEKPINKLEDLVLPEWAKKLIKG